MDRELEAIRAMITIPEMDTTPAQLVPATELAAYLNVSADEVSLIITQDPTFPKPVYLGGSRGRKYYSTDRLNAWKLSQLGLVDTCQALSVLLKDHGIELTDAMQATSGVYLLYKDGVLIYIGQSVNVYSRVPQHRDKAYDRVMFIPCRVEVLDEVETALIVALHPKLNGAPPIRTMRAVDLGNLVADKKAWTS